jgi:hypothetical protein
MFILQVKEPRLVENDRPEPRLVENDRPEPEDDVGTEIVM